MNLASAKYNLGVLALEQNDPLGAIEHLTSYTLLQPGAPEGWIKLANANLRLRRFDPAEKYYKTALELRPHDAEALNGMGNVAFHRRKTQEATSYFNAALAENPSYAPAVLNLAVMAYQVHNNRQQALEKYRQYVALAPSGPQADAVNAVITQLEEELAPPPPNVPGISTVAKTNPIVTPTPPTARSGTTSPPPAVTSRGTRTNTQSRPLASATRTNVQPTRTPAASTSAPPVTTQAPVTTNHPSDVEVTRLDDDLVVKPPQDPNTRPAPTVASPAATNETQTAINTNGPDRRGFFARLNPFASRSKATNEAPQTTTAAAPRPTVTLEPKPTPPAPAPVPSFPRYKYSGTRAPIAGNRRNAERYYGQGVDAQRMLQYSEAIASYEKAIEADPAYFEAYYNLGLAAYDSGRWKQSLSAYETALSLKPESLDSRYNFALALKQAGYVLDAAEELRRILQASPSDARAHLSLGNIYAQQLRQPQRAREHYLKLLEAEPHHPRASEIRFWLASNPAPSG